LELLLAPRLTLFAGAGALLGGTVRIAGIDHEMSRGWVATAGVSWLMLAEAERRPFVIASGVLGYSATRTRRDEAGPTVPWRAIDGRIGAAVGKSFGRTRPYLVGRAFGGPVRWQID